MRMLIALLFLTSLVIKAQEPHPLETLVNNTRALLVFAPSENDSRFRKQQALLRSHSKEMADRNLILIPILAHWRRTPSADDLRNENVPFSSNAEQAYIRKRFRIPAKDFAVILIGKDGGEKLRCARPVSMETLNKLIDAMPMRKEEMRNKRSHP